jgi:hypothetical protein
MQSITVTLDRRHLKAALICAAKQDIRWYLNGVLLELGAGAKGNRALLIATDGHRLSCSDATGDDNDMGAAQACSVIIPRDLIERVCRHKIAKRDLQVAMLTIADGDVADTGLTFTMLDGSAYTGKAIEARYPDWRRVTRQQPGNGRASLINPEYYGDIGKFFSELTDSGMVTAGLSLDYLSTATEKGLRCDQSVMATRTGCSAYMVVMPVRSDDSDMAAGFQTIAGLVAARKPVAVAEPEELLAA